MGVRLKSDVLIGAVFSLNSLISIPYNESGFFGGYSNDKFTGVLCVKSYQSNFEGNDFGMQAIVGYTWELQKNLGIGPSLSVGALFLDGTRYTFCIGILVKTLKPD